MHNMNKVQMLEFSERDDERGHLVNIEGMQNVPFEIKRVFYIYGSGLDVVHGKCANRKTEFVLINVAGTSKVRVQDGEGNEAVFCLNRPHTGIYLPTMVWKDMYDFSEDSVLLVLASEHYDADEYIRNYEEFVHEISNAVTRQAGWLCKIVKTYREKRIRGRFIDLVPFGEEWIEAFIKLRNADRNLYFFNQPYKLTAEDQQQWYQKYLQRNDDIFWCILDKKNRFIGTVRLYQIRADGSALTHGSFMIDEKVADEAPYALEAEVLSLDFAFDVLHTRQVICENRQDNEVMNSLSEKTGFEFVKHTSIRGVTYRYYLLLCEAYQKKREKIVRTLDHWARCRNE